MSVASTASAVAAARRLACPTWVLLQQAMRQERPTRPGNKALHGHLWCWGGCWRVNTSLGCMYMYVQANMRASCMWPLRFVAWYR